MVEANPVKLYLEHIPVASLRYLEASESFHLQLLHVKVNKQRVSFPDFSASFGLQTYTNSDVPLKPITEI